MRYEAQPGRKDLQPEGEEEVHVQTQEEKLLRRRLRGWRLHLALRALAARLREEAARG
jgi:hypothetical protein